MKKTYDAIVIGSGFGGLSAAATLAKGGLSVLVLEQFGRPGGFGQSYELDGYSFDTAVHAIWFWEDIERILEELGAPKLQVYPARTCDRIVWQGGPEFYATSIPEMKEQIQRLAPGDADGIARYYDRLVAAQKNLVDLSVNPNDASAKRGMYEFRDLWRMTLEEGVHSTVSDPLARNLVFGYHDSYLYDYSWSYPAHHLYITKYLYDGFTPKGGSQPLVDALVQVIERNGGDIRCNACVHNIIVEAGEAKGVVTDDGEEYLARQAVISNADGQLTLDKLLGRENLSPDLTAELDKWQPHVPSLSYYILNVGLDIDVRSHYGMQGDLTVYYPSSDILDGFKRINAGSLPDDFWLWAVFPSFNDASMAPEGHSTAVLSVMIPPDCDENGHVAADYHFDGFSRQGKIGDSYYQHKERITQRILDRADEIYPGLSNHVTVKDLITPQTIERTTLNYQGSTMCYTVTPELMRGSSRAVGLKKKTGIKSLYLVGGWTENGFSAPAVINSGREVAFDILGGSGVLIEAHSDRRIRRLSGDLAAIHD